MMTEIKPSPKPRPAPSVTPEVTAAVPQTAVPPAVEMPPAAEVAQVAVEAQPEPTTEAPRRAMPKITMSDTPPAQSEPGPKLSDRTLAEMKTGKQSIASRN